jgi:hypothetical protein
MTTTTACVEVLTAEVRVLMVGSRQVTLSVFRQLDRVDSALIQPFGRVRDKPANPGSDRVAVVGSSARPADPAPSSARPSAPSTSTSRHGSGAVAASRSTTATATAAAR